MSLSEQRALERWEKIIRRKRSLPVRLLVLLLISSAVFGAIPLLHPRSDIYYPTLMIPAAILMAFYGGWRLGILFTAATGLMADYFLSPPIGHLLPTSEDQWILVLVTATATIEGVFVDSLRLSLLRVALAKQEAERATYARDEIVGVISHELKNPLTALQTGVNLIEKTLPKTPENKNALKLIERLKPSLH